jgi:4-hydroxy-tetrahydrodipicolinate reductase
MVRVGIAGISGRMGREIAMLIDGENDLELCGGVVSVGSLAELAEVFPEVSIVQDVRQLLFTIDVLIDFSVPDALIGHASCCAEAGVAYLNGVTGLSDAHHAALTEAAISVPVFYARNMSPGIAALLAVLPDIVGALDGYDVEIVELHHRGKRDAPSGTALALVEAIELARSTPPAQRVFGRSGISPRSDGEIGVHAMRAGANAGEHLILVAGDGEEIRISHRALSRRAFAEGAIRAARWLVNQPPGLYSMADMLAPTQKVS